ncbi:hypothetical protein E2C01_037243 [Portunus trituberculatus]|uniref:Uncharacterized protein n=1 Tax=Portunus trituberculatus TaxID=210409 RepID=A0A5B7FES9_PORTR|nr:hypothetical protein [Portunus trituberculatus]
MYCIDFKEEEEEGREEEEEEEEKEEEEEEEEEKRKKREEEKEEELLITGSEEPVTAGPPVRPASTIIFPTASHLTLVCHSLDHHRHATQKGGQTVPPAGNT